MCAPVVIEAVRRDLSRRGFIGAVAACGAAMAVTPAAAQQRAVRLPNGFRDVIDLTHLFSPSLPVYPAYRPVQIRQRFSVARDGFAGNEVTFDEHTGTHVDAPSHFVGGAMSADRLPVDRLVAPLVVVSIADRAARDADTQVSVDDLLQWEKRHGRIPPGAFVAMDAGWDARAAAADRFLNRDAKGTMHTPGFGEQAARFLAGERDICGVGVDTLSLDAGAAETFVAHLAILGAGKYGVELLANLGRVPPSGATVVIGAPRHEGATGGPARVLALV
jgi:kynurenine formamidase